jgi:hypothetical protein
MDKYAVVFAPGHHAAWYLRQICRVEIRDEEHSCELGVDGGLQRNQGINTHVCHQAATNQGVNVTGQGYYRDNLCDAKDIRMAEVAQNLDLSKHSPGLSNFLQDCHLFHRNHLSCTAKTCAFDVLVSHTLQAATKTRSKRIQTEICTLNKASHGVPLPTLKATESWLAAAYVERQLKYAT